LSLAFLLQTLKRLNVAMRALPSRDAGNVSPRSEEGDVVQAELVGPGGAEQPGPLDRLEGLALGRPVRLVFTVWMVVFGLVGAQMSWVLRPFVGSPDLPFEWFRPRESNFFEALWRVATSLFS
ncbi:MAG: hypothetical protein WD063_21605, partial [Pirellulales bacterium]